MINPLCQKCGASVGESFRFCPSCGAKLGSGDGSTDGRLLEALRKSGYIEAIRIVREQTGMGLKEAKDYVDNLAMKNNITVTAGSTGVIVWAVAVAIAVIAGLFLLMQSA